MPTQQELEQYMAGLTPSEQSRQFKKAQTAGGTITDLDKEAQAASVFLGAPGQAGNRFVQRSVAGGTPSAGPALIAQPTRPAARLDFPQTMSKIDVSGSGDGGALKEISPISDRYQQMYDDASKALAEYEGGYKQTGALRGGSAAMRKYQQNLQGKQGLIRQQRDALSLLKEGSFADTANLGIEGRQQQAAAAENYLASAGNERAGVDYYKQLESQPAGKRQPTLTPQFLELLQSIIANQGV